MAATSEQIVQLYQQHLNRQPSQEEIDGWLTGMFGPDPATQIPQSGEAQSLRQSQPAASPPGGQYRNDFSPRDSSTGQLITTQPMPAGAQPGPGGQNFWTQNAPPSSSGGGGDPLRQFVLDQFRAKGVQPRDEQDIQYWMGKVSGNGGLANPGNKAYWVDRMGRSQGGAGDYLERPETGPGGAGQPLGTTQFAGFAGGSPAGFGAPPAPYQSQAWGGGQFTLPGGAPGPYTAPTFTAPTGITMENDPGYEFRRVEGQRGIESSAAARGSILSGGTLKAIDRYNQDYASNEFQNVYNRALGTFGANTQAGQFGAGFNENQYQNRVSNAMGAQGINYGQYLNENARTLNDYLTNYGIGRTAQNDYWSRLQDLANRGLLGAQSSRYQPSPY